MSGKPPESGRPLTFNPSVDDKEQLCAFLKGIYQQYLAQRSPTPQSASIAETQNAPQEDSTAPQGTAATNDAASATGKLNSKESLEQSASTSKTTKKLPAANFLEDNIQSENTGGKARKRKRESSLPASKQRAARASDPSSSGSRSVAGSSPTSKRVNHELIEKQLNVIARASLLRANTMNINAPDPEQDAPANETPVQKRRRLERINGRRKRARKLIEMDSLNERLVSLVDRNKKLKAENEEFRKKIDGIKRVNSEDGDLTKILEIISAGSTAAAVESAAAQVRQRAALAQVPPATSILQQSAQLTLGASQQPQAQALSPQQQTPSFMFGISDQQQQQQLFALLGNHQLSSLATPQPPAELPFSSQSFQYQQQQQIAALLPMLSATSGLYAGMPSNLQAPTATSPAPSFQHPRLELQTAGTIGVNSAAIVEEKMASPARRASTPPPKTVKELKAWMKKHRDEQK